MCLVCCYELKGWCKSFTRAEALLSLLQAVLLIIIITGLTFLTIHLLLCKQIVTTPNNPVDTTSEAVFTQTTSRKRATSTTTTLSPDIECTWIPSSKTKAITHYYWLPATIKTIKNDYATVQATTLLDDESDMNEKFASHKQEGYVTALVKLNPPVAVTFGCILTKVSLHWALTAASCIEAIEDVDALDSFFITESYNGVPQGRNHALMDVKIHPLYQGCNRTHDLAALRSDGRLARSDDQLLTLASMLDYYRVAIGERFTLLGFGGYREIDSSPSGQRLRQVSIYTVSVAQCVDVADDTWALRHLTRGGAVGAGGGGPGAGALCAGSLSYRGAPCAYCSGAPLVRRGRLYGVMALNRQCGVACEPQLYVNVAALSDWIYSVIR